MRETKFRVWDIARKCMCTVDRIDWGVMDGYGMRVFCEYSDGTYGWIFPPEYDEEAEGFYLVQYTGLHDKNGKEIYEGDIIEGMHDFGPGGLHKRQGEIKWRGDGYMIHYWEDFEVIGNIYDNPDLLGKKI